ncbi:MAG: citramalate synthase [Blastocatellia bacterium]|nr:citramalate synthase [Blastocatellia bacterium]
MKVKIYDTTLRDGTQGEGVSFSVEDKILIARKLDELGIDYIEGGWPGSNVRDAEFFARARNRSRRPKPAAGRPRPAVGVPTLSLKHARLTVFGSTCHPRNRPEADPNLAALLEAETPTVTIFGKTWNLHVIKALGITLEHNLEIIESSVAYLKSEGREVIYDAEHFFDGFRADPDYAIETLRAAERGGADTLTLCDTNGGTLTDRLKEAISQVRKAVSAPLGIHTHNDSDLAVANSAAAVECGAEHVQGTINGYGERCGNANLCSLIPLLELKLGRETIGRDRLAKLTQVSRYVAELANLPHRADLPFVGRSAFAHKGGVHVSAVMRDPATYEHIAPELTGNNRRVLVSDLSGKSNILYKAAEMGIAVDGDDSRLRPVVNRIKELEHEGFQFEAAEASFRLMLEGALDRYRDHFELESYSVSTNRDSTGETFSDATVRVRVAGLIEEATAEGCGPVHALDRALRLALSGVFKCLGEVRLIDYKVRVLDTDKATAARVRVLVQSSDGQESWSTVGVSDNILEASWQALSDALNYKLLKAGSGAQAAIERLAKPLQTVEANGVFQSS